MLLPNLLRFKALDSSIGQSNLAVDLMDDIMATDRDGVMNMDEILAEYFASTEDDNTQLKVLGVKGLGAAVKNFVEKDDKDAIGLIINKQFEKTLNALRDMDILEDDDIDTAISDYKAVSTDK